MRNPALPRASKATRPTGPAMLNKGRKGPMSRDESLATMAAKGRSFGVPSIPSWAIEKSADREATALLRGSKTGRLGKVCPVHHITLPLRGVCEEC